MTLVARPTTYNGINMRSRWEATVAAFWDKFGMTWEYEPRAFGSSRGQYLPDFLVWGLWLPVPPTFVEVKGRITDFDSVAHRMDIILESFPNSSLVIIEAASESFDVMFRLGRIGKWRAAKIGVCRSCHGLSIAVPMNDFVFFICPRGCADVEPLAYVHPGRQ